MLRKVLSRVLHGRQSEAVQETGACGLCGGPTNPVARRWSRSRRAWICSECIPPYVVRRGLEAVHAWLDTGEVPA